MSSANRCSYLYSGRRGGGGEAIASPFPPFLSEIFKEKRVTSQRFLSKQTCYKRMRKQM